LAELDKKQNFWTTMPGILTGIAALLTAATGLFVAVYSHGDSGSKDHPAPALSTTAEPSSSAPIAASSPSRPAATQAPANPVAKATVTVTSREGEVTKLFLKTFKHNYTDSAIELTSGQTISFDKIKAIDFFSVDNDHHVAVKVTLTDGRTLDGILRTGYVFVGETDIGSFKISVENLKQIVFER
jgi:hypothetical protein